MQDDEQLRSAAQELYGLLPGEFTAARNARATVARKAGDRALADRVRALPRPTASAWVINQLGRELPEELDRVLQLGRQLRHAQQRLDAGALRELGKQRQSLIDEVVASCRELADEHGQSFTDATSRDVAVTLTAAMADPTAAAAVSEGLLVSPLTASGFEAADVTTAVAIPPDPATIEDAPLLRAVPAPAPTPDAPEVAGSSDSSDVDEAAPPSREIRQKDVRGRVEGTNDGSERKKEKEAQEDKKRQAEARAAVDAAAAERDRLQAELEEAEDELAELQQRRAALSAERKRIDQQIAELRVRRTETGDQIADVEQGISGLTREQEKARRTLRTAQQAYDKAREALEGGSTDGR